MDDKCPKCKRKHHPGTTIGFSGRTWACLTKKERVAYLAAKYH